MAPTPDTQQPTPVPRIQLRNLRKRFGERWGLAGIDLTLDGAGIVGIVGADGAGKTTLIRALAGLLVVEADEADVLGYDLRQSTTALKAHIGYVPQVFSLHRDLSVIENLRFTARLHRLTADQTTRRTDELLQRTALAPFANRAAGALSGGMKQKLAIANALLVQPSLLLLDEPTAGVDVVARGEIWALLKREAVHALVLMSTSYLDEIAACDRLMYLADGRVTASGTPAALQAATALDLYVAWGPEPRSIVRAVRALPYVHSARAAGRIARIEVTRAQQPDHVRVLDDLRRLPDTEVDFAERAPIDMETTLLALSSKRVQGAEGSRVQVETLAPGLEPSTPRTLGPASS
jgi:ABC-2 type transport system ATP-binding protein